MVRIERKQEMTQNKFWLVWQPNIIYSQHETQELAKKEAKQLAVVNQGSTYYVLKATHHFKADVNVVETVLSAPTIDNALEFGCVSDEFKVGDRVLLDNYFDCIVDDYIDETKSYKVSFIGSGRYCIAGEHRLTHA